MHDSADPRPLRDDTRNHGTADRRRWLMLALLAEAAIVIAAAFTYVRLPAGPLTAHMIGHAVVMGPLALAAAHTLLALTPAVSTGWAAAIVRRLGLIAAVQLALFLLFHTPDVHHLAMHVPAARIALFLGFTALATLFWTGVVAAARSGRAKAMIVLLLTGKAFCLIAFLLVVSTRGLYGMGPAGLADQQAAGLVMLVACPLTYIGAGVVIAARWLAHLGTTNRPEGAA